MDPKPGELEPSSAGTGFETPGHQCLLNWEMKRTTVDGCLLVDGTSHLGGHFFFWENPLSERRPIVKLQHCLPHQKSYVNR